MNKKRDYPRNREAYDHPAGFTVIVPKGISTGIPLFCTVCTELMRDPNDPMCYVEWKCCQRCTTRFAEPNRFRWLEGWRPDKETLDQYIAERKKIPYMIKW